MPICVLTPALSKLTVLLLTCMTDAIPMERKRLITPFDSVLYIISHTSMSAWGIFVWVQIQGCGNAEAVMVLFGQSVSFNTRGLQIFAITFFAYIGMLALSETVRWGSS
jgi:hypothetical protein